MLLYWNKAKWNVAKMRGIISKIHLYLHWYWAFFVPCVLFYNFTTVFMPSSCREKGEMRSGGAKGSQKVLDQSAFLLKKQKKQTWKSGFSFHSTTGFQLDSCCEVWSSESTLTFFQWTALFVELLFQRSTSTNTWTAVWAERKRRTASGGRRGLRTRVCSWVPLHCRTEQQQ